MNYLNTDNQKKILCEKSQIFSHEGHTINTEDYTPFAIDVYIDLRNFQESLSQYCLYDIDYSRLVNFVVDRLVENTDIVKTFPVTGAIGETFTTISRGVYCFTSKPVNVHPDDASAVKHIYKLLHALQHTHGFNVQKPTLDFNGYHLNHKIREKSRNPKERAWNRRQKAVDTALVTRLMSRCLSINPPKGVIIISGDVDFLPALEEVAQCRSDTRIMVAAFSKAISGDYFSKKYVTYPWVSPLILDNYIKELKCMRYRPRKIHNFFVEKHFKEPIDA